MTAQKHEFTQKAHRASTRCHLIAPKNTQQNTQSQLITPNKFDPLSRHDETLHQTTNREHH